MSERSTDIAHSHRADPNSDVANVAERLRALLGTNVTGIVRFPSGFSWLTYGFRARVNRWRPVEADYILRLGPPEGLFAPYSAAPQFHALCLVAGSRVPAPRAHHWSDDPEFFGAPFFICDRAPGEAPIPWGPDGLNERTRHALGVEFAEMLGELHSIDWRGSALSTIEAPPSLQSAATREIARWEADYRRWRLRPHPMVHRALAWLRSNLPEAPRISVIHGDYRLGNFLSEGDHISALLDWELVHLGDPHEDIAWASLPQYRAGTPLISKLIAREEFSTLYRQRAGFEISQRSLHFYTIFSLLKLAITHMAGVNAFERRGFIDLRMPAMGTQIAPVLRQIEKAIEADP
jgi:aminoglycoside phosphotransferase (APT) family kinase protein